jgi:mannose-6-phosphate isomerase-like protein (cupin superfamily)
LPKANTRSQCNHGGRGLSKKINLAEKLSLFSEHWRPMIVSTYNDNKVYVVKVQGEFVWHKHDETDDFFLVVSGRLTIRMRDGDVELGPGELFVVPRGVEHCPYAEVETHVMLIEPLRTVNTGDAGGPLTAEEQFLD